MKDNESLPEESMNELYSILSLIIINFVIIYIVVAVHEFGHVLAVWLVGGKVKSIEFGRGKTIFKFKKLCINNRLIIPRGAVNWKIPDNTFKQIIVLSGGILFVLLFGLIINVFPQILIHKGILRFFNIIIIWNTIINAFLPSILDKSIKTDGQQIYRIILKK
jgi:hypothetical protein